MLHSAGGIDLSGYSDKTGFICFNQDGTISLNGEPLKSEDPSISLASNISSTEKDVNIRTVKVLTAIDSLSRLWKSDLSDEIKWDFFQDIAVSVLLYGCTTWILMKRLEKSLMGTTQEHDVLF